MGSVTLEQLLQQFKDSSLPLDGLTWEQVVRFVTLASNVKNDIILTQPTFVSDSEPPDVLPPSIVAFLGDGCELTPTYVENCWKVMKGVVWSAPPRDLIESTFQATFTQYGHQYGLGTLWTSLRTV
jgi:hypothetical protein